MDHPDRSSTGDADAFDKPLHVLGDRDRELCPVPGEARETAVWLTLVEVMGAMDGRNAGDAGKLGRELSVQVGMDQVGVHEVRPKRSDLSPQRRHQRRADVATGGDHRVGDAELLRGIG